jgi:aspartate racemase
MKRIVLIGGMSYPSTVIYYTKLNQLYQRKLGGYHSCPFILYNIDYHAIKSRYQAGWNEIPQVLKSEFLKLLELKPDGIILANNTLHKALDLFIEDFPKHIHIFHSIELTKACILQNHWKNILFLGTKFTMEDSFFTKPLQDAGINVQIPNEQEREEIQIIQSSLAKGIVDKQHISYFQTLTDKYEEYDEIVLGCTELPLVYEHVKAQPNVIDTIDLQCESAINFLLRES